MPCPSGREQAILFTTVRTAACNLADKKDLRRLEPFGSWTPRILVDDRWSAEICKMHEIKAVPR